MRKTLVSFALGLICGFPELTQAQVFTMDADGIVSCNGAAVGDTGTIDGVTYTAVDKDGLIAKLALDEDVTTVCTSLLTDLNGTFTIVFGVYIASDGLFDETFNQDIGGWDVSNVTQMIATFYGATAFNQDLDAWDVSNVTVMAHAFGAAESFNQDLNSWDVSNVTDMYSLFRQARAFNGDISAWDVSNVRIMHSMFRANQSSSLIDPLCTPYCGGNFNQDISGWDVSNAVFMDMMFSGQGYFNQPIGAWNTGRVVSMFSMFSNAIAFNQDIGGWNTSNVVDMNGMFSTAIVFNQDISGWDVSNVATMRHMFYEAKAFNQDISGWDVSSAVDMGWMFMIALAFNQDIGGWNVSNVTAMDYMFASASSFNQDLSGWNVSNVTTMNSMFTGTQAFNQPLGTWDVSNVTDMKGMFSASAFNQDISGWNTSKVTDMAEMFYNNRVFNQDIGGWDVSNVTNMRTMFPYARAFNQDIGGWNTSKVTDMALMFLNAESFNQDIGGWDVSSVQDMRGMFSGAQAFDQDLSAWDVSSVGNMREMFTGSLSTANYDALLNGWSRLTLQNGVWLDTGSIRHTAAAAAARKSIADRFGWTFNDGGLGLSVAGGTGPRLMASPRRGAVLSELLAPLWTQGMEGADTPAGTPNVWVYEHGARSDGDAPSGWLPVIDLGAHNVAPGRGFLVNVFADTDLNGLDDLPVMVGVKTSGDETTEEITLPNIGAGEWVLAGNPYGQTLDWDLMGRPGLEGTVYVYDHAYADGHAANGGEDAPAAPAGGWRTWNGVAGSLTDGLLAPYQGFFVQGGAEGGSLTMSMDHSVAQPGEFRKSSAQNGNEAADGRNDLDGAGQLTLTLSVRNPASGGRLSDRAYVSFTRQGLPGRDAQDALKLLPLSSQKRPLLLIEGEGRTWGTANLPLDPPADAFWNGGRPTLSMPLRVMHVQIDPSHSLIPLQAEAVLEWDATRVPEHVRMHLRDLRTGRSTELSGEGRLELDLDAGSELPLDGAAFGGAFPALGGAPFELTAAYESSSTSSQPQGRESGGFETLPRTLELRPNHPNPFNPETTLRFGLPEPSDGVTLTAHDMLGRRVAVLVKSGTLQAGWHTVRFDAGGLPSGVYTVVLTTPRGIRSQTVTMIK